MHYLKSLIYYVTFKKRVSLGLAGMFVKIGTKNVNVQTTRRSIEQGWKILHPNLARCAARLAPNGTNLGLAEPKCTETLKLILKCPRFVQFGANLNPIQKPNSPSLERTCSKVRLYLEIMSICLRQVNRSSTVLHWSSFLCRKPPTPRILQNVYLSMKVTHTCSSNLKH